MTVNDLYRVRGMLQEAYETVRKNYYDPSFRGLDWESRYHEYDEKLKNAPTMNAGLTLVAGFLGGLNDSHTRFLPPPHAYAVDYGYHLVVIGENVFVERVRPGTDAASKVYPGDQLLSLNGGGVGRESFRRMWYTPVQFQEGDVTVWDWDDNDDSTWAEVFNVYDSGTGSDMTAEVVLGGEQLGDIYEMSSTIYGGSLGTWNDEANHAPTPSFRFASVGYRNGADPTSLRVALGRQECCTVWDSSNAVQAAYMTQLGWNFGTAFKTTVKISMANSAVATGLTATWMYLY
jgi:hypothetical protein